MRKNAILKLITLIIAISMLLSLVACRDKVDAKEEKSRGESKTETETKTDGETVTESEGETVTESEGETVTESEGGEEITTESSIESESKTEPQSETKTEKESKTETKTETKTESKTETKTESKTETKTESITEPKTETETETETEHTHSLSVKVVGNKYAYACEGCDYVEKRYNVSSNIEGYIPAEELQNGKVNDSASIDTVLMSEGSSSFIRMDNMQVGDHGWMGINFISKGSVNSGRYMAIKLRMGENGTKNEYLKVYLGTTAELSDEGQNISFKVSEDGSWHTVIIDMAERINDSGKYFVQNEDGSYTVRLFQLRPLAAVQGALYDSDGDGIEDAWKSTTDSEDYMDIEFIAFFDALDDIKELVEGGVYEWSESATESKLKNLSDHTYHTSHSLGVIESSHGYTVKCTACGETAKQFSYPEGVNWVSSLENMTAYQASLAQNQIDENGLLPYNRFSGNGAAHLNLTGGDGAGTWTNEKHPTGEYVAIKYRAEGGTFTFNVSTKDNGGDSSQPGRPLYKDVGSFRGGDTLREWRVAIVKIPSGKNYTQNANKEIFFQITTDNTSYTIDIAYVAVLDSISEITEMLMANESFYYHGESFSNVGWKNVDYYDPSVPMADPETVYTALKGSESIQSGPDCREYIVRTWNDTPLIEYLAAKGYARVEADVIDGAMFRVTVMRRGNETVTVYWNQSNFELRAIYESASDSAISLFTQSADFGTGEIEIAQIGIERVNETDNPMVGLLYIIKLSDGRAIIVDGGFPNDKCALNLYNSLGELGIAKDSSGKYRIAAWIFTHGHIDHIGIFTSFTSKYPNALNVEYIMHSFGSESVVSGNDCDEAALIAKFKSKFPNATVINSHYGLKYYFGNAAIEMLYTPEMLYGMTGTVDYYNTTSLIFKVSGGGTSALFTGDASEAAATATVSSYETQAFKSDILQITHHGLYTGGGEYHVWTNLKKIYDATGAKYAFLPMGTRYGTGDSRNGRFTVMIQWCDAGCQISYVMNENDDHGLGNITQAYFNEFEASRSGTLYGYDGFNKVVNENGLITYLAGTDREPTVTIFKLSGGKANMTSNKILSEWLGN